jgi:hypothetical protein
VIRARRLAAAGALLALVAPYAGAADDVRTIPS